ncbi:hypothetical protein HanXRQr2_Chr10g0456271 [Helianthus annuus]|uniref:Uncharacterized protein n=1 Tax=Helianthus annuus TaxID=4232 RepID=A0A9K3I0W6_HELAN|nr:hypothetical protein HanXRQr2_Chr10g0456271 [Helianthus annuus]KAJ0885028.1 hypothetical protein HanPSC8_Chr10g0440661 [Helianthus annuus]
MATSMPISPNPIRREPWSSTEPSRFCLRSITVYVEAIVDFVGLDPVNSRDIYSHMYVYVCI